MTIALIIPVLNEQDTLSRLLTNVRSMGFHEIIVVDGGSQDRTLESVKPFLADTSPGGVQLLSSARGRATQMNAGASAARAEVLVFLHADTSLPDSAVQHIQ